MRQQIRSRRPMKAPTGAFPPNKSAGLSARSYVTFRSTRQFSGLFLPQQGIVSMFFSGVGRQPISASPVLFLANEGWIRGCNAVGCANTNEHRPTNTRNSFSIPEAVISEVEQRFDCVQAQTHMFPSLVGGFHPHPEPNSSPPSPKSYPLHRWDAFTHRGPASLGPQQ